MVHILRLRAAFITALFAAFGGILAKSFSIDELPSSYYVAIASLFSLMASLLVSLAHKNRIPADGLEFRASLLFVVAAIGWFFFYNYQFDRLTFTYSETVPNEKTIIKNNPQAIYLRSNDYTETTLNYIKDHELSGTKNLDSILVADWVGGIDQRDTLWNSGAITRTKLTLYAEYVIFVLLSTCAISLPLEHLAQRNRPSKTPYRIACLGWGSLIWSPGDLPLDSKWFSDGPQIPVEFSRQSADGRITLVINPDAAPVQVLWARLKSTSIAQAREALGNREGTTPPNIHSLTPKSKTSGAIQHSIQQWCCQKKLDAVVWTGLPPKFNNRLQSPTAEQLISYLRSLEGDSRIRAEEYIRKAPVQIRTTNRDKIEAELGWLPNPHR